MNKKCIVTAYIHILLCMLLGHKLTAGTYKHREGIEYRKRKCTRCNITREYATKLFSHDTQ